MIQTDTVVLNDTLKVEIINNQETLIEFLKEPNNMIALTAIILSILSLIYAVRFNRKTFNHTKHHDKLSVEPLLSFIHYLNNDNVEYLTILNNGLGPAKLTSIKFMYNDEPYNFMVNVYSKHFSKAVEHMDTVNSININIDGNYVLASNDKLELFKYNYLNRDFFENLNNFLNTVEIEIIFETVYQEKRVYKSTIRKIIRAASV